MASPAAQRAVLIAGPTASGKSALALALAERHGGVVINADSMQVYADLAILTARPTRSDTARVPHRLFGHINAADPYSVGRWIADMRGVLTEAAEAGRLPVIVGGTGLYLKALTEGLSDMPDIPADLRAHLRQGAATLSPAELHIRLAAVDPEAASRLRPSDPQRILRALEVHAATGRSIRHFQARRAPALLPWEAITGVFLIVERPILNSRIDARFDAMMASGALTEVERLVEKRLDPTLPAMRSLGVPHLMTALTCPAELPAAIAAAKSASRAYAKRQVTYAQHQLGGLDWLPPDKAREAVEHRLAHQKS